MPKKKERSSEEFYRGKLREAERQIRDLHRQVRSLEKEGHIKPAKIKIKKEEPLMCPECGKGEIKITELVGRVFHTCGCCGYRKKASG